MSPWVELFCDHSGISSTWPFFFSFLLLSHLHTRNLVLLWASLPVLQTRAEAMHFCAHCHIISKSFSDSCWPCPCWSLINLLFVSSAFHHSNSPLPCYAPLFSRPVFLLHALAATWPQGGSRRHSEGDQWPAHSSWYGYSVIKVRLCCVCAWNCICLVSFINIIWSFIFCCF